MRRGRVSSLMAAASLLAPAAAQAHLVSTGFGPVYDGAAHFGLSPEDGLPVIALALFAGLRGPACSRLLLAVLPVAWFCAGLATAAFAPAISPVGLSGATALILMVIGALLAGNVALPPRLCAAVALVLGFVRGAADASGVPVDLGTTLTLAGAAGAVFGLFALAASVSLPLRRIWTIVAARVAGSWLAAVGLLLAGWLIRYGTRAS